MKFLLTLCAASVGIVGGTAAQATYTTVDLSGYANTYNLRNYGSYPTGTSTGNQGLDVPFQIAGTNGNAGVWLASGTGSSLTVPLNLSGQTTFYALLNNYYGTQDALEYTITISTASNGDFTFDAIGGVDTRDYNQNQYTNGLDLASTTTPWFDNGQVPRTDSSQKQRFDMRQFTLPALAANDTITGFTITQVDGRDMALFAGLTFSTEGGVLAVPEPASWAMMLLGFGAIGYGARRRRSPAVTFD